MKHRIFIGFILGELLILVLLIASGRAALLSRREEEQGKRDIVQKLMLTDVAVWTEARYTRNPSQADLFSAFQDFPSSLEHFPAGSIIAPERAHSSTIMQFNRAEK